MARVIGWKIWYADGRKAVGQTVKQWKTLDDDGVVVVMLYYDEFATDGVTRYRRIMQSTDYYWLSQGINDHIYGQGNESEDEIKRRYPTALVKRGMWVDDDFYKVIVEDAMADHEENW